MAHFKRKIVALICWLWVLGIIESMCAVLDAEMGTYIVFSLLGVTSYALCYDLF